MASLNTVGNPSNYDIPQTHTDSLKNQPEITPPVKIEKPSAENRTHSAGLNAMNFQFADQKNYKNSAFRQDHDRPLSMKTHYQMERDHRIFAFEEEV